MVAQLQPRLGDHSFTLANRSLHQLGGTNVSQWLATVAIPNPDVTSMLIELRVQEG